MQERKNLYGLSEYLPPERLMTEAEYRERIAGFGRGKNLTEADEKFWQDLEDLRNDLYDMIAYNKREIAVNGKKYYIANNGDDNNDGLSPQSAWATLQKVSEFEFQEGDGVYFKRGDLWRGNIIAQSGVTYQAYGNGPKPKIWFSFDGTAVGEWKKTDTQNLWVLDTPLDTSDIGVVVFDQGKAYAEKKRSVAEIKADLDFCFAGECSNQEQPDNKLYICSEGGSPTERYAQIELSCRGSNFKISDGQHDIKIHNLDLRYGQDYFFAGNTKNIEMSYCLLAWQGGHYFGKNGCRYGGGGGCWHSCKKMEIHHSFFTQQFDCSATPQFTRGAESPDSIFEDFLFHDNLVEYTEYSFEYFNNQTGGHLESCYKNLYIGYNLMRHGGKGFGDKKHASRYIKGWRARNTSYDTVFEYNIFDRAKTLSLEFTSRAAEDWEHPDKISYEYLPHLCGNVYIEPKDKKYAEINYITYSFNQASQITLEKLGVEEKSTFIFSKEE